MPCPTSRPTSRPMASLMPPRPFCGGPARLTESQREAAREAAARRDREAVEAAMAGARAQLLARSGVPAAFREPAQAERGRLLANRLLSGELRCAFVSGPVGRGKTDLACAVVLAAVGRNVSARFVGDAEMLAGIRSAADDQTDTQDAAVGRLVRVGLLAIDDLGKSRLTSWGAEQLWRVVDGRWREGRPTVVTTNLDAAGLGRWLWDASPTVAEPIMSRLSDRCELVTLDGPDRRRGRG